jgi:hypothetical protein
MLSARQSSCGLTDSGHRWYALAMAPETETENRSGAAKPQTLPWDRQPGESAEAFRAFLLYRDQDPKTRSMRALDPLVSHTLGVRWAKRWRWVSRVAEWAAMLQLNQADLNEATRIKLRSASVRFALSSLAKAERKVNETEPSKLSIEEALSLAKDGVKLGRQALDLADGPRPGADSTGLSVSLPSVPWLAAFVPQTKPNEPQTQQNEIVVHTGEQVLDETPRIPARKRLVNRVADYKPDDLQAPPDGTGDVKSERAKPGTISSKEAALEVAPPNKEHPYRRCKKHGNACRRGGHN